MALNFRNIGKALLAKLDSDKEREGFQFRTPFQRASHNATFNLAKNIAVEPSKFVKATGRGLYDNINTAGQKLGKAAFQVGYNRQQKLPTFQNTRQNLAEGGAAAAKAITFPVAGLNPGAFLAQTAISGGLNKAMGGSFTEGAAAGANTAGLTSTFIRATNPILGRAVNKLPARIPQVLKNRLVPAAGNIIQGVGLDKALGSPTTAGSVGLDLVTGIAGGKTQFDMPKVNESISQLSTKGKMKFKPRKALSREEVEIVDDIITNWNNTKDLSFPDAKFIDQILTTKANATLDQIDKLSPAQRMNEIGKFANISERANGVSMKSSPVMGLVSKGGESTLPGKQKLKFETPYKRGDIKQLETRLDEILGTDSVRFSNKWQALQQARNTAKDELMHYAKNDPDAAKYLREVEDLEKQIMFAQDARVAPKSQPTKGVEATRKLKVQAPVQTEIIPKIQAGSSPLLLVQDKQSRIPQQQKITLKNQPLDNQNIELKNSINQPSEAIIADARNMIGESAPGNKKSLKQVADEAYTQWVDRFYPLTKASQKAKADLKTKGAELRPEYDPEYLVRRLTGASSIADHRYQTELKPVIDMVDKAGIEKIDMDAYLANRRMAGFGDIDREVYGADPVKSKAIVQALEQKYPQIKGIADQLYAYQDKGLNEMVEAGFISKKAAEQMRSQNPDYSPLYRVMDDVNEYLGLPTRKAMQGTQPIKKLKGSTKKIESPLESIIGNTFSQRAAIEKNRVASSVVGLQSIYPDMGFSKVAKSGTDTITIWKDGVKEYWQVGADIAEASKGANEEAMNAVLKILQAPAALLRQGATGRNPDFMIPNIVRDQFDAATTSKYGYLPFVDYTRGLFEIVKKDINTKFGTTFDTTMYDRWANSGAKIDLGEMSGRQSIKDSFDEKTTRMGLRDWLSAGLDKMGKYSEQPTRVGLFKKAYEKTGNELLASMESRDSTVDFARMGSKMKVANSIIPFLNVQVQGFDKLIRATKDNPGKVAFNAALYGVLPGVATTLYNLAQMPEEYAEIPQYVKDANFVIVTGRNAEGTVDYISIPKGNVIPIVSNPAEHFINFLFNQERQSFSEFATNFLSSSLPVVGDGSSLKEVGIKTIGQNLPQAIKPAAESLLNKSFWKYDQNKEESKEIVPSYLKKKEPFEQAYEWTPPTYKAIGAALNVSPLQVQNLMEGHLAGYIKVPNNIIDSLKNISEGQPVEKNKIPILRRFMGQTYPSSGSKKTEEVKPGTSFMERITGKADATETAVPIPTDQSTFTEVYKQALSKGKGWTEEYNKIMYDPTLTEEEKKEKLADKKADMIPWAEMLIRMEDQHPEKVFEAEVKAYATGGGELVEDRGDWVKKQLDKIGEDKTKRQELINRLWDEKVLTSGSKGVAQYLLDNYDLDVSTYTGKGKGTGSKPKTFKVTTQTPESSFASGWTPISSGSTGTRIINLARPRNQAAGTRIAGLRPNIRV